MAATIASFLMAITGSLAARVMVSLGVGVISYAVLSTITSQVVNSFTAEYNSTPGDILAILNLAGAGQGFGVILAALTAKAALNSIKRIGVTQQ